MKKLFSIFFIFLFSGCANWSPFYYWDQHQIKEMQEERMKQLIAIDLKDGVNQDEASLLGNEYFLRYVSGCGGTSEAVDRGSYWEVGMVEGIAALPVKDKIHIDKTSGAISMNGKPTVTDPLQTFSKRYRFCWGQVLNPVPFRTGTEY